VPHEKAILEYETRPTARFTLREAVRQALWFCLGRPMRPLEIATVWIAASGFFYGWVMIDLASTLNSHALLLYFPALSCGISTAAALVMLYRRRAWGAAAVAGIFLIVILLFSGIVQITRCPHATYLQTFGFSVPIHGDACGNVQDQRPWWMTS
jgi:hypothetical protein